MKKSEFHISVSSDGKTALDLLAAESGLSRQKIKQAMQKGCVWLEQGDQQDKQFIQRLRRAKKVLKPNMVLHCYYDENVMGIEPPIAELVSDEGDYSIWNKPCGMFSQGSKWSDHCTIYRWAEKNLQPERPAFIVHRLDRAANGLILLAHKKTVAAQFSALFQKREVTKKYQVVVHGDFMNKLDGERDSVKTINEDIEGKKAISHIKMIGYNEKKKQSKLEVSIETGRKHQIRIHLSQAGFPVVGDRIYGNSDLDSSISNSTVSGGRMDLQLSAIRLEFECPLMHVKKQYSL